MTVSPLNLLEKWFPFAGDAPFPVLVGLRSDLFQFRERFLVEAGFLET
jgi:hypothetical protein